MVKDKGAIIREAIRRYKDPVATLQAANRWR